MVINLTALLRTSYGQRGWFIITQELGEMFPSLSKDHTKPWSPDVFLGRILGPETAVRLIKDDVRPVPLTEESARELWYQSRTYGDAVYPVLESDWEHLVARTTLKMGRQGEAQDATSWEAVEEQESVVRALAELKHGRR